MHDLERRLGQVVEHCHHEQRESESTQRGIPAQRGDHVPVATGDHHAEQDQAEPSEVQVNLQIAVVRLVRMPPVRLPEYPRALAEPEAVEPGAEPRVDADAEQVVPQSRPCGEGGISPHRLEEPDVGRDEQPQHAHRHDAGDGDVHDHRARRERSPTAQDDQRSAHGEAAQRRGRIGQPEEP